MKSSWIKRVLAVSLGLLFVVGAGDIATIPSFAAHRQEVDISYQPSSTFATRSTCGKAQDGFNGTAAIGGEWLIRGGMSVAWCWKKVQGPLATDKIPHRPSVNTWAEARFGWVYDGISSKVRGHGHHCANGHCWEYYYYRYYFKFTRNMKLFTQTCVQYIAITVRGNGTYTTGGGGSSVC